MAIEIIIPKLDAVMVEATILNWRKKEGDWVEKGEIIFDAETEKITFEVEAPTSGILSGIKAKEWDVVPVGQVVAFVLQPGEAAPEVS